MSRMSREEVDEAIDERVRKFARGLGLNYLSYIGRVVGEIDRDLVRPCEGCRGLDVKLNALIDWFGLEYNNEPKLVIKKKGKK